MLFEDILPLSKINQWSNDERKLIYDSPTTLWAWFSQILEANASCHKAVTKVQAWREHLGLEPPSPITDAYCKARKRLPNNLLELANDHVLE